MDASPQSHEKDAHAGRRRLGDLSKETIATATAAVALVAASVGLLFDLWPTLKPDPGTHIGAEMSVSAVERNVTYGAWLRRSSGTEQNYQARLAQYLHEAESDRGLRIRGELAYVKVRVWGFKRRSVTLHWSVYNARTQQRTSLEGTIEQGQQSGVRLDAPTDEFVAEMWIPPARGKSSYFVRIEAREADGTLLAIADSSPFVGLAP